MIRIDGEQYWPYAAVDPDSNGLLHTELEPTGTNALAEMFFGELREKHGVEAATPLKEARHRHVIDFRDERHGNHNSVECVIPN